MSDKKEIISASPKVRILAREFGANIYQIQGSQRKGRISEEDVKSHIKDSISGKVEKKQIWAEVGPFSYKNEGQPQAKNGCWIMILLYFYMD